MLYGQQSREQMNNHAETIFRRGWSRLDRQKLYDNVRSKFGVSTTTVENMITFKRNITEFTTFEVFAVLWFCDKDSLKRFFTQDEIETLSQEKIEKETIEFPIVFSSMVQVTPDQWIGKITVKQIMALRDGGLINYAENEQRAMKVIKHGHGENIILTPWVNKKSVKEIAKAMEDGNYVPDTITLNMPDGSEYDFDGSTLTVHSLPKGMFNLDDGYHRYLAMAQIYNNDNEFDYPMELRVISFSNAKANWFIYQQNKKNPMKRVTSDAMDPNSVANMIIQRMNQDPGCNIQGMIGHNSEPINDGVMNKLITYFFLRDSQKTENKMKHMLEVKAKLTKKFNALTEQDARFLGRYTDQLLLTTIYIFASDVPERDYAKVITEIYDSLSKEELKFLCLTAAGNVRIKALNILGDKISKYRGR